MTSSLPVNVDMPFKLNFGDGELIAAPTLEFTMGFSRDQWSQVSEALWQVIETEGLWPLEVFVATLTISDSGNERIETVLTPSRLAELRVFFEKAASIPIRRHPVTLLLAGRQGIASELSHANAVRISLAPCFFPDDPLVASVAVSSTSADAWDLLASLRDALLEQTHQHFFWSTLGYGFACSVFKTVDAAKQMEVLCMRYLGVQLQDLFGHYTITAPMGLRSVNWQVCIGAAWLEQLSPESADRLAQSARPHKGSLFWQACDRPSVCDRNDSTNHDAIRQYQALHDLLRGVIFVPMLPWFPFWRFETIERWASRWDELDI